jgi:hypothetical protein
MRFAYADPPYVGCGRFYPEHPNAKDFDNPERHVDLMYAMDSKYDGWALSLSSPSLRDILKLAPRGVRVAAWVKPFAAFKRNVRIAYTWEPVIFKAGRNSSKDGAPVGRDHLAENIALRKGLTGAKPVRFCDWVLDLLGYVKGDTVDDLFPGTHVMGRVVRERMSPQTPGSLFALFLLFSLPLLADLPVVPTPRPTARPTTAIPATPTPGAIPTWTTTPIPVPTNTAAPAVSSTPTPQPANPTPTPSPIPTPPPSPPGQIYKLIYTCHARQNPPNPACTMNDWTLTLTLTGDANVQLVIVPQ